MSQMSQKDNRSCYFMESSSMDFQKVNYKNVKKNNHFITGIPISMVTDILKFYEVLFCTYCNGLFCL